MRVAGAQRQLAGKRSAHDAHLRVGFQRQGIEDVEPVPAEHLRARLARQAHRAQVFAQRAGNAVRQGVCFHARIEQRGQFAHQVGNFQRLRVRGDFARGQDGVFHAFQGETF